MCLPLETIPVTQDNPQQSGVLLSHVQKISSVPVQEHTERQSRLRQIAPIKNPVNQVTQLAYSGAWSNGGESSQLLPGDLKWYFLASLSHNVKTHLPATLDCPKHCSLSEGPQMLASKPKVRRGLQTQTLINSKTDSKKQTQAPAPDLRFTALVCPHRKLDSQPMHQM